MRTITIDDVPTKQDARAIRNGHTFHRPFYFVIINGEQHDLDYRRDEDGDLYAFIPAGNLLRFYADTVLAEIDGGTYGQLHGWRIYLEGNQAVSI